jgi:hypothetical protein
MFESELIGDEGREGGDFLALLWQALPTRHAQTDFRNRWISCAHFRLSFDQQGRGDTFVAHTTRLGVIMAKRKKGSKAQKRAKLRRGKSAKRGKSRKAAQAKTVAKAKSKRASVKKAAPEVKQPVAPVVETVAVEVIEQPAPGVIAVTEVEETEVRKAS